MEIQNTVNQQYIMRKIGSVKNHRFAAFILLASSQETGPV